MRWGKVVSIHAFLDTQVLTETLNRMVSVESKKQKWRPSPGKQTCAALPSIQDCLDHYGAAGNVENYACNPSCFIGC